MNRRALILTTLLLTGLLPLFGLANHVQPSRAQSPQTITIGFYGSPTSPAARGMQLALDQIASEGSFTGADGNEYLLEAVISDDPADLVDAIAVLALPPAETPNSASLVMWDMPTILLDHDAPLALAGVQATIFRGMTSRDQLDETLLDFLTIQSGVQRIILIGESDRLGEFRARMINRSGLEIQQQPSALLTSEQFRAILDYDPQTVFFDGDPVSAFTLAQSFSQSGWSGYFVYDNLRDLLALENFQPPAGVRFLGVASWLPILEDDLSQSFAESYRTANEQSPNETAVAAYDLTWVIRLMVGRVGADPDDLLIALPITPLIRTTEGTVNPAAYGGVDLYRNAVVFAQTSATERLVLARYDDHVLLDANAAVVALPTATLIPSPTPSQHIMTITTGTLNVRQGPDDDYAVIGQLTENDQVIVLGQLRGGGWYLVQSPWGPGWVVARFGTVFDPGSDLPVLDAPPPPTPTSPPTPIVVTATPGGSSIQVIPPSNNGGDGNINPPPANASFMLGGQIVSYDNVSLMQGIGMTWVKEQVRWELGETAQKAAAGAIEAAKGRGMRILIGSVGWNYEMASMNIDAYMDLYVDYLVQVAALNPDAIEIWNEPNIDAEWQNGQINGAIYTRLLQKAYPAIKNVNPNVMVISAAPAPTGFFQGCAPAGCDDDVFIRQMADAGAANYLDCIGMHFNEGIISPDQRSGDPRGSHHSYYLPTMIDMYSSTFGGAKPICITELGFLSGEDFGGVPAGFEWASNTSIQEHADWLGRGVAVARQSGQVQLVVIWNVNFKRYDNEPRAGYAMIRRDGSCPACITVPTALN